MLTVGSTMGTAILRGVYQAFVAAGGTFFVTWGATGDGHAALIAAGTAAFIALGFRAGVEGTADARRDKAGDVRSADVGQPNR